MSGQFGGQALYRVILGMGQLRGVLVTDKIGAARGAVQHRPAGEYAVNDVVCVTQHITCVMVGVPGRVHNGELDRSGVNKIAVGDSVASIAQVVAQGNDVLGTGGVGQFQSACHIVVVDVGLEHVGDPDVPVVRQP